MGKWEYDVGDSAIYLLHGLMPIRVTVTTVFMHSFKYKYEVVDELGFYYYTNDLT